jgi:hypothetical protein
MKIERHGRAKILSHSEIQLLFSQGLQTPRDRALFGICTFPGLSQSQENAQPDVVTQEPGAEG